MLASTRFAPAWVAIAAGLFCRAGKARTADRLYEQTATGLHETALAPMDRSERGDRANLAYMQGIVALSRGKTAEAIQALELSLRLSDVNQTLIALASANAAAGKTDDAIARYLELTARPELGYEGQEPHILAHYELGKLYERRKQTAKAQEYYQRFLDLWKEADPDLKPVVDAQARLKKSLL